MNTEIVDFIPGACELLGLGEPTHGEPAFGWVRNELIRDLVDECGFRSVVLETDRVAALALNEFVGDGRGTLDEVLTSGFSHGFGEMRTNRMLIEWLHDFNLARPKAERVTVHGFDAPTEFASAPSPRRYLLHAIDYLKADIEIDELIGDEQRWSRSEAVMDARLSQGATAQADSLRATTHDLLISLYSGAPELISSTSLGAWRAAEVNLTAALGLLAYHKQAAQQIDEATRVSTLLATRDAIMARNLVDIRAEEGRRGATIVFAHNRHLQRQPSRWTLGDMKLVWHSADAIIDSVIGPHYTFIAGSLGTSPALGLRQPPPDTYEGLLGRAITEGRAISGWSLVTTATLHDGRPRTDVEPNQGYFPLDEPTIQSADPILHISDAVTASSRHGDTTPERKGAQ